MNCRFTPGSVLPQASLTALAGLQPPIFKVSKDSLLLLLLLPWLVPSGHHFQLSRYNYSYNCSQNTNFSLSRMLSLDFPS